MKKNYLGFISAVMVGAGIVLSSQAGASVLPHEKDEARDILKETCDRITRAHELRFFATTSTETVLPNGRRESKVQRVDVVRRSPGLLFVRVRGQMQNADLWFDGKTLTKVDVGGAQYATVVHEGSIQNLLDHLAVTYNAHFPLADFLVDDVYANFTESVTASNYAGIDEACGEPCHHLVFQQEKIDWEMWVAKDGDRLPRRLQITYKSIEGNPKYVANIGGWLLHSHSDRLHFNALVPSGAQKTEFSITR